MGAGDAVGRDVEFACPDGHALRGTWFAPVDPAAATIVICAAIWATMFVNEEPPSQASTMPSIGSYSLAQRIGSDGGGVSPRTPGAFIEAIHRRSVSVIVAGTGTPSG